MERVQKKSGDREDGAKRRASGMQPANSLLTGIASVIDGSSMMAAQRKKLQGLFGDAVQLKEGVPVNDNAGLEREADMMGAMAMQNASITPKMTRPYHGKVTASKTGAHQLSQAEPVQFAVSNSATFPPSHASTGLIGALDQMIPTADLQAQADLANPPGGVHTRHQAVFINRPSAMNWGYCVEEQLNPLALAAGWNTQYILSNSRPDYERVVTPNTHLFVDLTSVAQAGVGGNHITGKLHASNRPMGHTWEAADITHNGPPGGPAPVLRTNGNVSPLHMRRFQAFKRYCNRPQGGYHPSKDSMRRSYRGLSHATFTQVWDKNQRARFSQRARQAGFR